MADIGICFVTTRDTGTCGGKDNCWPIIRQWYREAHLPAMKFQLPIWGTTDPQDIAEAIADGVRTVVVCTSADHGRGYDPKHIRRRLYDIAGSGLVYANVLREAARKGVTVWVEVGNEPDLEGVTVTTARDATIRVIRELRQEFPEFRWAASMPTRLFYYDEFLTDELAQLVDGIATHLYGGRELGDAAGGDWWAIYQRLLNDKRVKTILITECGIEDKSMPVLEKCARYRAFARSAPAKVAAILVFTVCVPGRWANGAWDGYCLFAREHFLALTENSKNDNVQQQQQPSSGNTSSQGGPSRYFHETQKTVKGNFLLYWEAHGGVAIFGFPVTNEVQEIIRGCKCMLDGKPHIVQYFERAVFELHPGLVPHHYNVLLRRLGAEAAARAGYKGPGIPA